MARGNTITLLRTTRSALDTQAAAGNLKTAEPYFITDENRYAVGLTASTYQTYAKQGEAEAALASRLVPVGGSNGQVLSRDATGNAVWTTAANGGGTSGPISQEQLPLIEGASGQFNTPAAIYTDPLGRVLSVLSGPRLPKSGIWNNLSRVRTATFDFDRVLPPLTVMGVPSTIDIDDDGLGNYTALKLPKLVKSEVGVGQLGFLVNTSPSYRTITIRYKMVGSNGSQAVSFQAVGGRVTDATVDGNWKTATVTSNVGAGFPFQITYQDLANSPDNQMLISQITYPDDAWIFGDVVTYSGRRWQCLKMNTEEMPGTGSEWAALIDDQIATTAYVSSALPPRGVSFFAGGTHLADDVVGACAAPYAFNIDSGNSVARAVNAATVQTIYAVKRNGTQIGSVTFPAGATVATLNFTNNAVAEDDFLTVHAPSSPDSTLANVTFRFMA